MRREAWTGLVAVLGFVAGCAAPDSDRPGFLDGDAGQQTLASAQVVVAALRDAGTVRLDVPRLDVPRLDVLDSRALAMSVAPDSARADVRDAGVARDLLVADTRPADLRAADPASPDTRPAQDLGVVSAGRDSSPAERPATTDGPGSGEAGGALSTYVSGEQRIAILLVSFPSMPLLSAVTADAFRATYFGPKPSVDSFLREISYGKTWATGQVFGPFVLDADYFNQLKVLRDAAIRAASKTVDLTRYNRLVLVVPQASAGLESGGKGSIGSETVVLPSGRSVTLSTSWLGDASAGDATDRLNAACHELGHNLGLRHARAADFGDEPLGPLGQPPAPWDQMRDYGDSFSNMARGTGHWAAPHKAALGWIREGAGLRTVTTSGTFLLRPYETADNTLKALRVQRGTGSNAWLWLEYRRPDASNFDAKIPPDAATGALVHYEDADWKDTGIFSNLVRFAKDDSRGTFFGHAPLAAGTSFKDPYTNLTLAVGTDTGAGLPITVTYAPTPAAAFASRTLRAPAAGGQVTADVAAQPNIAWSAASLQSWLSITIGASGIGQGRLTASVAPNTATMPRWGRIVLGQATLVVVQDGAPGNVSISPDIATAPAAGTAGEIEVATSAEDYPWSFSVHASWIQSVFFSKLATKGSGTLRYIVAVNPTTAPRTGTITVGAKTFTITQEAGSPNLVQLVWERQTITDAPMSRRGTDMAGQGVRGESILWGGNFNATTFPETWAWNGTAWKQKLAAHNPGRRTDHAMAYDAARNQIVMFGGFDSTGWTDSTWVWDGADWLQMRPAKSPPARANHAMAYDPVAKKVVMFGGRSDDASTWLWDGTNWSQVVTTDGPIPREGPTMAYDGAQGEVVMFGGARDLWSGNVPFFFCDTWAWDGARWTQRPTLNSPSPRTDAKMEYDPELGKIVLVGGYGGKDVGTTPPYSYVFDYREETWTWDGTQWTQQFPANAIEFSYSYGMAYDPVHRQFVTHIGDDLHCATRGPKTYVLRVGPGAK